MGKHKSTTGCGAVAVVIVAAWICIKFVATMTDAPNGKQWANFEERRIEMPPESAAPQQTTATTPRPPETTTPEPAQSKDDNRFLFYQELMAQQKANIAVAESKYPPVSDDFDEYLDKLDSVSSSVLRAKYGISREEQASIMAEAIREKWHLRLGN